MDMDAVRARIHLGNLVRDRREELGLSVREAARRTPIDRDTWTSLEAGRRSFRSFQRRKVEHVLGWAAGSIAGILAGNDPRIATDPPAGEPAAHTAREPAATAGRSAKGKPAKGKRRPSRSAAGSTDVGPAEVAGPTASDGPAEAGRPAGEPVEPTPTTDEPARTDGGTTGNAGESIDRPPPGTTVDFTTRSPAAIDMLVDLRYIDGMEAPATVKEELMHLLVGTHIRAEAERQRVREEV